MRGLGGFLSALSSERVYSRPSERDPCFSASFAIQLMRFFLPPSLIPPLRRAQCLSSSYRLCDFSLIPASAHPSSLPLIFRIDDLAQRPSLFFFEYSNSLRRTRQLDVLACLHPIFSHGTAPRATFGINPAKRHRDLTSAPIT